MYEYTSPSTGNTILMKHKSKPNYTFRGQTRDAYNFIRLNYSARFITGEKCAYVVRALHVWCDELLIIVTSGQ